jgi:hypothetical protein
VEERDVNIATFGLTEIREEAHQKSLRGGSGGRLRLERRARAGLSASRASQPRYAAPAQLEDLESEESAGRAP